MVKKAIQYTFVYILLTSFLFPFSSDAQGWGGRVKPGFWDTWSVTGNVGLSSFYGDLSIYDSEIVEKFTKESDPAFGLILTKHFSAKFGASFQLLYGGLHGENGNKDMRFEASFIEYNFHARANLINIIAPDSYSKFGMDFYAGIGQFIFSSTLYDYRGEEPIVKDQNTGTPEFVYFFGAGINYKFTDKFGATIDLALRQAQNDKLDDFKKNDNFDYYTLVSVGVTYYIESIFNTGRKSYGSKSRRSGGRMPMRRRR
jgi:hypothetical protein